MKKIKNFQNKATREMTVRQQQYSERWGRGENTVESDRSKEQQRRLEEHRHYLSDTCHRIAKDVKSFAAVSDAKHLSDGVLAYRDRIHTYDNLSLFAESLDKTGQFERCLTDLRTQLCTEVTENTMKPLKAFIKDDIQHAKNTKKRFDKVRALYDSSLANVSSLEGKGKVNVAKLKQAESERDLQRASFQRLNEETEATFFDANKTAEIRGVESVLKLFDAYQQFFRRGNKWIENLQPTLDRYKEYVSKESESFAAIKDQRAVTQAARAAEEGSDFNEFTINENTKTYGVPVEDLCKREGEGFPRFLTKASKYLAKAAIDLEGIFRVSAGKDMVDDLRVSIDQGKEIDFEDLNDPHAISNLFKLWLRQLPEPLLTFKLYTEFIAASKIVDDGQKLIEVQRLMAALPLPNRKAFQVVINLCTKVDAYQDVNKMNATNLAIVIAPNILYAEELNPITMVQDMAHANGIFVTMVKNADSIFPEESAFDFAKAGDISGLKCLVAEGKAELTDRDDEACTLLHTASLAGQQEMVSYLLSEGLDIDAVDSFGMTPLHRAVMGGEDNIDTAVLLLSEGADDDIMSNNGISVWDKASKVSREYVITLRKAVADRGNQVEASRRATLPNDPTQPEPSRKATSSGSSGPGGLSMDGVVAEMQQKRTLSAGKTRPSAPPRRAMTSPQAPVPLSGGFRQATPTAVTARDAAVAANAAAVAAVAAANAATAAADAAASTPPAVATATSPVSAGAKVPVAATAVPVPAAGSVDPAVRAANDRYSIVKSMTVEDIAGSNLEFTELTAIFSTINMEEMVDACAAFVRAGSVAVFTPQELQALNQTLKPVVQSLRTMFSGVRSFVGLVPDSEKQHVLANTMQLQEKTKLLIGATKNLNAAPSDPAVRQALVETCQALVQGLLKFFDACDMGVCESVSKATQGYAESVTQVLKAAGESSLAGLNTAATNVAKNCRSLCGLVQLRRLVSSDIVVSTQLLASVETIEKSTKQVRISRMAFFI
eukprot:TRINITY_DN1728_c0_g1_i3.p1 TRINITY_DN1728_c0_g1~~TRINITY_DN1728_c0_g1_i3.p1  ORF type:complete len:1033 (-),score=285.24 TRINITY_DN1728_c0_g1_i3:852-3857(-)